jgi:predicted acylesterase/phospholipase RssA
MSQERAKTALVLAGGGIMGAAYEIGCLTALDRLFTPAFSTRRFDIYVGISAGSVVATLVANRLSPAGLYTAIANNEAHVFNFHRSDIYRLDMREIFVDFGRVIRNLFRILRHHRRSSWTYSFVDLLHILQEQFPAGLFSLEPMQDYLCRAFRQAGMHDDFHLIRPELYIPAVDIDRGERVIFGSDGFRDIHICQAITASCAIPIFFRPHLVGGRFYVDGSVGRVAHLDIAIERGAKLIVVINPRVPMVNDREKFCLPSLSSGQCSSVAELGISFAWEQCQRIETKQKLDMGLTSFRRQHPDVDIILIEPGSEESLLFLQSPMSFRARNHIMHYGYNLTLDELATRYEEFREIFARHGIVTRPDHLREAPPVDITY